MKLISKTLGIAAIGGLLALGACQKSQPPAEPTPAAPVAVQAGAQTAPEATKAPEVAPTPAPDATPTANSGEGVAAAAVKGSGEADCPFHEDHAAKEAALAAGGEPGCAHAEGGEGGCAHEGGEAGCAHAAAAEAAPAAGEVHFGAPFTVTEAKPLSALVAANPEGGEEVVQVSGTIHEVCQAAGCWMVVRDGEREARVVMKGHAFTVPKDSKGKAALVEGTLKVRTFSEAQAMHLAEDAGKDPATVTGELKEYVVTASAVTIKG